MRVNKNEMLWVEKYRPQVIEDCILSPSIKAKFQEIADGGEMLNYLLTGTAGLGKTTVAKALCEQLGLDYLFINASKESGIDVLRNKIEQFASSVSLGGGYKVIILDEADYLNAVSTQPALRAFIEEFSKNCRFILTCNFENRLLGPLHSRFKVINFNTSKKELATLAAQFMSRLEAILKNEGVTYNKQVLAELIMKYAPDWRRVIGEAQGNIVNGELSTTSIVGLNDEKIGEVVKMLKEKDFKNMRIWVANNVSLDSVVVIRKLYDAMNDVMQPDSIPGAVITLADYSYKSAFVADKELNLVACLTEIMGSVNFK